MNIRKAIVKVFSANFFQLISSLIVGFVVPSILTLDGYANLKTYTLLISYIGLLHLGFIDGLYIKYGGKKFEEIDKAVLKGEHNFLILFQFLISLIVFFISIIIHNYILILFSISILPIMIQTFFKNIFQATGKFDKYSKIMYLYTITYLLLNILLALIFKSSNYILYCLTTYASNLISVLLIEISFIRENLKIKAIINKNIFNNIKVGFFVLLGNIIVIGLFGIDKWFVKLFLTNEDFAYYSFAVSMLNIITVLVNAISITFYNYLFENNNEYKINNLKNYLIILGAVASCAYFPLLFIVKTFIPKYMPSLDIIAVTFSTFPYMILINALFVNLYKVNKNEKHYFKVVLIILLISILYNTIAIITFKNSISLAFATILTLITWVIYSSNDIKQVNMEFKTYIYLIEITLVFLITAHYFSWYVGSFIYLFNFIFITLILKKEYVINFYYLLKGYLQKTVRTKD